MQTIDMVRDGAHVFERLSLYDQIRLVRLGAAGERIDDVLLAEIGKTPRGSDFLSGHGADLDFSEIVHILGYVDRFVERRVLGHLDEADPELAERVKQNLFVFEDLLLLDGGALEKLIERVERQTLAAALSSTPGKVRDHVLSPLSPAAQGEWLRDVNGSDAESEEVRDAQSDVLGTVRRLWEEGVIRMQRQGESAAVVVA